VSQGQGIAHEAEDTVLRSAPRVAEVLVHVEPDDKDHLAKLKES
jgi:divalent metal cation (Fe/Co/Zn/Cd) transporter